MCRSAYFSVMDRPQMRPARRLLDFVAEAESAALSDWTDARELILSGLTKLIPCDVAVCCEGPGPSLVWTATDPTVVEPRVRELDFWLSCYAQLPWLVPWDRVAEEVAVRFSDRISQRAFRRTPVHDYFFRPFGLDHVVGARVALPTGQLIDFVCESGGRDFADPDVSLLERLRPYLGAILCRAQAGALALHLRSTFALTRREAEVLALLTRGRSNRAIAATLFVSPGTVRKHLEHLYTKLAVKTRTEAANRALAPDGAGRASDAGSWQLNDLLGPDLDAERFRPRGSTSAVHLREMLGLTPRELQVLQVASEGRTNADIAAHLGLAPGTVKKHLERVYAKLEVNSRTEASARILGLDLRAHSSLED
jgi:DNA-binding NarL/FixJ family response regulator